MAYNPYTADQINSFIDSKGVGNDPWAMLSYAKQYNADPMQVAAARGIDPTAAQQWLTGAQQQLAGPIADTRGLADRNPYMAYNLAQQRGYTADQAATLYGKDPSSVQGWLGSTGLSLGAPAAAPVPAAAPAAAPPAAMPATMPAPPNPYTQQQSNPYMPGGTRGNDPRVGGPSQWGQQGGIQGLGRYLSDNPHMLAMGNEIARGVNNNLQRNTLTGIGDQFSASGTYGGSRHGVAEGLATGEAMSGLAGALANLYGNQFNTDRGYGLQSDALDFNIHRGNLQDMRQGQQDQLGFLNQMANWGQQGVGIANQTRDRQFTDWNRFVQPASQMAGLGGQSTQNLQGNPAAGVIGGLLSGFKLYGG